jgi:hypothetical protein
MEKECKNMEEHAVEATLMCCGPAMELLERFSVPWRWDASNVVKVLVRARIA